MKSIQLFLRISQHRYLKIWLVLVAVLLKDVCSQQRALMFNSIINMYKKTSLPLREDIYQKNLPIMDVYDYVIVGAGPAGCTLANRLTEDPATTVLLLEAGPEPFFLNDVPITSLFLYDTEYNWKYKAEYDKDVCRAMNEGTCPCPAGKGLGGGTVINALIYTRGNKQDYDWWAELGNPGWAYDDVLKYFKKLENVTIPELRDSPYRGKNGPVGVAHSPYRTNASLVFLDALKELGYPEIDYNQPYRSGYAKMQLSMKNGARSSASNSYLKTVSSRPNLHLTQRAFVTKVLIDPETKEAFGVEFIKKGVKRKVIVRKEVIVSAGALTTPKLLMLSGVGPKEHLEKHGIKVIKNLPVGDNLQEHVGGGEITFLADPISSFVPDYKTLVATLPFELARYMRTRDGPPSSPGVESVGYVSSRYSTDNNPDIELLLFGASFATDYGTILRKSIGLSDATYNRYYKPLENVKAFGIWVMGLRPKSRGTVRLKSSNPLDNPVITNNFLSHQEDVNVIIDGIRKAIEISETKAMKAYGVKHYRKNLPGCENIEFGSDEYWECVIRQVTCQFHHPVGTCKMGPDNDPTAVVDSRLRVRGIKRLRVVDGSIMPIIPAGHTQAPVYMIGEKAADMIKEDNKK